MYIYVVYYLAGNYRSVFIVLSLEIIFRSIFTLIEFNVLHKYLQSIIIILIKETQGYSVMSKEIQDCRQKTLTFQILRLKL